MRISLDLSSYLPTLPTAQATLSKAASLFRQQAHLGNLSFASGLAFYYATGNTSALYAAIGAYLGYHRYAGNEAAFMQWLLPDKSPAPPAAAAPSPLRRRIQSAPRRPRQSPAALPAPAAPPLAASIQHPAPGPLPFPRFHTSPRHSPVPHPLPSAIAIAIVPAAAPSQEEPYVPVICEISFDLILSKDHLFTVKAKDAENHFNIFNFMIWAVKGTMRNPINPTNRTVLANEEFQKLLDYFGITKEAFQALWPEAETHGNEIYKKVYRKNPTSIELQHLREHYPVWYKQQLADVRYRLFLERAQHKEILLQHCPSG